MCCVFIMFVNSWPRPLSHAPPPHLPQHQDWHVTRRLRQQRQQHAAAVAWQRGAGPRGHTHTQTHTEEAPLLPHETVGTGSIRRTRTERICEREAGNHGNGFYNELSDRWTFEQVRVKLPDRFKMFTAPTAPTAWTHGVLLDQNSLSFSVFILNVVLFWPRCSGFQTSWIQLMNSGRLVWCWSAHWVTVRTVSL